MSAHDTDPHSSKALSASSAQVADIGFPVVDVAKVRRETGLSQAQFAQSIGIAKGTLLNWEHGRRNPTGPARVLLALIAKNPTIVQDLLPQ